MANEPTFSRTVRVPGVPSPIVLAIEELQRGMQGAFFNARLAATLVSWGLAQPTDGSGGGVDPNAPVVPGDGIDLSIPPIPKNLVALAGYAQVMLRVDPMTDSRFGYFEWFRSETDDLGTATSIGQSASNIFPDASISPNITYYYWARTVSKWSTAASPIVSGFNQAEGTSVTTSPDIEYALGVLTGDDPDQPFYYLADPITVDGTTIPAGTYIKEAYILDAVVKTFRAGLAVIDTANIITLNASKIDVDSLVGRLADITTGQFQTIFAGKAFLTTAMIGDGQITNAKIGSFIQSTNWDGSHGWYLGKDGTIYLFSVVARGDIQASSVVAGVAISAPSISGGTISGVSVSASSFTGNTYTGGLFQSSDGVQYLAFGNAGNPAAAILQLGRGSVTAKIMGDGSTQFSNTLVTGTWSNPFDGTVQTWYDWSDYTGSSGTGLVAIGDAGFQSFVVDTGVNIPDDLSYSPALTVYVGTPTANYSWTAGGPSAGDYLSGWDVSGVAFLSSQTFHAGATPNPTQLAQDPLGRALGYRRLYLRITARPNYIKGPALINSVDLTSLSYRVVRVT